MFADRITRAVSHGGNSNSNALACGPSNNVVANCVDASCNFMTRHTRILKSGPATIFNKNVAMANATCFNLHPYLSALWFRYIAFN